MEQTEQYAVEMLNITKRFGDTVALDNVSFYLKKGEILAILGENGAGKSTLMSVLFGLYLADKGIIKINGKPVEIPNSNSANALGIGMVHQHFKLVECYSVLDNIILGSEDVKRGLLQKAEAKKKVIVLSEKYGFQIDPDAIIGDITVGMQQRCEILKTLYRNNEILIFDEPTAVLTPQETEELLKIMKTLAAEGKSIIFITHKLNEVKAIADRCVVLRKGKYIGEVDPKNTTEEELSAMMVGRKVDLHVPKTPCKCGDVILEVRNLTVPSKIHKNNAVKNVSFDVHAGEIVALTGIDGNGMQETIAGITGLEPASGHIYLKNKDIIDNPIRQKNAMISHIPEDRHKHGLILEYSIEDNIVLQRYFEPEFCNKFGFMKRNNIRKYANGLIEEYDIRSGQEGSLSIVKSMSGGNQQKVIIARESDREHSLMIAVQPTRGLDIGATEFVHKKLIELRDSGKAVLLVSLELDEVLTLADRVLVMYEGEIVGEFRNPQETTQEELGLYMSGARRNEVSIE